MSDPAREPAPKASTTYRIPEVEQLLDRVTDLIDQARPMPLSTSAMINKDEILDLLAEVRSRLPEELRAARWLLKEREEFLEKVKREGEDLLEEARSQAERMVQRTEVVKAAEQRGRQIVEKAEARLAADAARGRGLRATRSSAASRSPSSGCRPRWPPVGSGSRRWPRRRRRTTWPTWSSSAPTATSAPSSSTKSTSR